MLVKYATIAAISVMLTLAVLHPMRSQEPDSGGWENLQWKLESNDPLLLETKERSIAEDEVPELALAALQEVAGSHKLLSVEQEIRGDQSYYEAEWQSDSGEAEATVSADGTLMETEQELSSNDVPSRVRRAAEARAGNSKVSYARRCFFYYEAEYIDGGAEREVLLRPTGEVVGIEMSGDTNREPAD